MRWNRASCRGYDGKPMETETTTWSEFPDGGKLIVKQILVSEERNRSKRAWLWESQSEIGVRKLTIWERSSEMDVKVSKDKHTCRWVDRENLIYVRLNRINNCTKMKKVINREKRRKTLSEVTPVEKISKNQQSFLDIRAVEERKSFLHINWETMHMTTRILSD